MQKNYTAQDLLRYIYKETTQEESKDMLHLVKNNIHFREELVSIQSVFAKLNDLDLGPDPTSLNIIMEYSQKLHEPAH